MTRSFAPDRSRSREARATVAPAAVISRPMVLVAFVLVTSMVLLTAWPADAQNFGRNRIQYRDFDWKIYHSTHFDIYYYETEEHLLQKTASLAESAYDELSRAFDFQIQEPTPMLVYETHSAFLQNNIYINGVPEAAQAFAVPARFRMVLPLDIPDRRLLGLIRHELTHIFQFHILYRGRLGAGLRGSPPQWFMEGMASYFGDDETDAMRKFMVDLVVNDNIPSVEVQGGGYLAYRYGNAVFSYIEERWGKEAVLDLIYEYRNTLGGRIGRAIERTFRMSSQDFDDEFRRWARKRYLPRLIETGEPGDFGRPFRIGDRRGGQALAPTASPSGDLVASLTSDKGEADVSIFDANRRTRVRILTKGLNTQINHLVVHNPSQIGGDLAFSPDGNTIAAFARREKGYSLVLIDVLRGGLRKIVEMDIEQQRSPAYHPDGKTLVFAGNLGGQQDIFSIDLETLEIHNLTDDELFDGAPTFSPDGRWLTYTSYVGEHAQIFRFDVTAPEERFQLTQGEHHNKEPAYSASGDRIYFVSDRTGADNIYGLDLERSELIQFTNAVTGCEKPVVLPLPEGGERLVYQGYWKGRYDLFMTDVEEPVAPPVPVELPQEGVQVAEVERYEPDIEVTIDEANMEEYGGFKFFLEDIQQVLGVDTNQIFQGRMIATWSDLLGDRRILGDIAAVDTFSDFSVTYLNLRKRRQWAARVFNTRVFSYFGGQVFDPGGPLERQGVVDRIEVFRTSGATYTSIHPISSKRRFELTGGAFQRKYNFGLSAIDSSGNQVTVISPREDEFPRIGAAFVSDSRIFGPWGAISGHGVRLGVSYAPDLDESGTLETAVALDARKYVPLTRRSNFAFRLVANSADGNFPTASFIGGLDTVRGYNFREFGGFRTFYANAEIRFPLIDQLAVPGFALQGIRGILFFDVGGAWFPEVDDFDFYSDGRLQDAVASFGWGLSLRFAGFDLNWDFVRRTDLEDTENSFDTEFWIGRRF